MPDGMHLLYVPVIALVLVVAVAVRSWHTNQAKLRQMRRAAQIAELVRQRERAQRGGRLG